MQNPTQWFRESSTDFERPGVLSEKFKIFSSWIFFFVEILHTFLTYQCLQKSVQDFFLFRLDLELFAKIKNDLISTRSKKPGFFHIFINHSGTKQTKKNPEHCFADIVKWETRVWF